MVHALQRLRNQGGNKWGYVVISVGMMTILDREHQKGTHPTDWWMASQRGQGFCS